MGGMVKVCLLSFARSQEFTPSAVEIHSEGHSSLSDAAACILVKQDGVLL